MQDAFPDDPTEASEDGAEDRLYVTASIEREQAAQAAAARVAEVVGRGEVPAAEEAYRQAQAAFEAAPGREGKVRARATMSAAQKDLERLQAELWLKSGGLSGGFFAAELARVGWAAADLTRGKKPQQDAALTAAITALGYHPRSNEVKQLRAAQKQSLDRAKVRQSRAAHASELSRYLGYHPPASC
jgi:hypothetical protein